MQDIWYGDKRDLAKWGVVLTLANRYSLEHVLQVLYYRPNEWPALDISGETVPLPLEVIQHFRNANGIRRISACCTVDTVSEVLSDRTDYHEEVLKRIRSRIGVPGIVFLDPDTGLEPAGKTTLSHVLEIELASIWNEMQSGDLLVFYQHQTNRNNSPWIESKKEQFEKSIGIPLGSAQLAQAQQIARDVVFFFVQKSRSATA